MRQHRLASAIILSTLILVPKVRANEALFKGFIESPPANITSLIFRVKTAGDSIPIALVWDEHRKAYVHSEEMAKSRGQLESGLDKDGFRWFVAKWQEDGFLVRGIDPTPNGTVLTDNPNAFRSGGRYASNYWCLFGGTLQTWTATGPLPPGANSPFKIAKTSSAHRGALVASEPLRQLLNMGIMSVDPGTIRWDGDHFTIPSRDIDGVTINGKLLVEGGRVSSLELHYNQYTYLIEYGYSGELPLSYLPNRFVVSHLEDQQKKVRCEFEIISMQTSTKPLGLDQFGPLVDAPVVTLGATNYLLHTAVERHWVYTNGGRRPLRLNTNGMLEPIHKPAPLAVASFDIGHRRRQVTLALAALLIVPIVTLGVLWVRNRRRQKLQQTKTL